VSKRERESEKKIETKGEQQAKTEAERNIAYRITTHTNSLPICMSSSLCNDLQHELFEKLEAQAHISLSIETRQKSPTRGKRALRNALPLCMSSSLPACLLSLSLSFLLSLSLSSQIGIRLPAYLSFSFFRTEPISLPIFLFPFSSPNKFARLFVHPPF